jgi:rhomboid protease GluP
MPRLTRFPVTLALVVACVVLFAVEVAAGALGPDARRVFLRLGAVRGDLVLERGEVWRLVTAAYLHGGLLHLAMNLSALVQLAALCELVWGPARTLVVYHLAAIGGALLSCSSVLRPSVGASGAILGLAGLLLGATWFAREPLRSNLRGALGQRLAKGVLLTFALGLGLQLSGVPIVDNAGHAGGLATGILLAAFFRSVDRPAGGLVKGLAALLVAATLAALGAMAVSGGRAAASELDDLRRLVGRAPREPLAGQVALEVAHDLARRGDVADAVALLCERVEREPDDLAAAVTVADLVRAAHDDETPLPAELIERARLALLEVARQAEAHRSAGRLDVITLEGVLDAAAAVHARAGRREEALALEARGLWLLQAEHSARSPPDHALDNALAWALVTRRDPALDEPERALGLVDRALLAIETGLRPPDPGVRAAYLDTRAAALVAAGRWNEALTDQRAALAALESTGAPAEVLDHFRGRLAEVQARATAR